MYTITRRVMQLTQRYHKHGLELIKARKKALDRANFERDVENNIVDNTPMKGL